MKLNKKIIIGLISIIVIIIIIYGALLLEIEKGAESSWAIGVGLFGTLCGGGATLIAVLLSIYENRRIQKEILEFNKLNILETRINEYVELMTSCEKILKDLDIFLRKFIEFKRFEIEIYIDFRNKLYCTQNYDYIRTIEIIIDAIKQGKYLEKLIEEEGNSKETQEKLGQQINNIGKRIETVKKISREIKCELNNMYDKKYSFIREDLN